MFNFVIAFLCIFFSFKSFGFENGFEKKGINSSSDRFENWMGCYRVTEIKGFAEPGVQDPNQKSEARYKNLEDFTDVEGKALEAFQLIAKTVLHNRTVYSTFYFPCILEKSGGVINTISDRQVECSFNQTVFLSGERMYFELIDRFTIVDGQHIEVDGRACLKSDPNEQRPFYKFSAKFLRVQCSK